jgi:hypothetical protein
MLTLYVLPSEGNATNIIKTAKSVGNVLKQAIPVKCISEINSDVETPWYAVLYDNEVADAQLEESFRPFLVFKGADVLKLYKRIGHGPYVFSIAPRIFRSGIRLRENSLIPENCDGLKFETVLNGWLENIDED